MGQPRDAQASQGDGMAKQGWGEPNRGRQGESGASPGLIGPTRQSGKPARGLGVDIFPMGKMM